MANFIAFTVHGNGTGTANVDDAQLATLQEEADAELFANFTAHRDRFRYRHDAADDNTVNMAVHHGVLISDENLLN